MIKTSAPPQAVVRGLSPGFMPLLQLALTLLVAVYMLFIGGTFDASLRYRVQLLNTLGAALLASVWVVLRSRRGGQVAPTGLEWTLGLFAVSQWLALWSSAQPRLGLEWVALVMTWTVALLILCDVLRQGWPRMHVFNALALLAAVIALQGLAEVAVWYAGWLGAGQWPPFTFRLNGLLGHANLTAGFVNALLPLVLVMAVRAGGARRLALGGLAAGLLATLFFTSSRAGWLAGGVELATLAGLALLRPDGQDGLADLWLRAAARWRALPVPARWLLAGGLLVVGAAGAALLVAQSQHISHGPLFSSRSVFWETAWRMFTLQPLTGAGPDLFPWYYTRWVPAPPNWFAPHAHSLPMQILGGSGLVGVGALVGLGAAVAWQLWRGWRAASDRLLFAGLAAGLAGLGFQHLFDFLAGSNVLVFVVVVVLALALTASTPARARRGFAPLALAPVMLIPLAVAAFALRGAALNDRGLTAAAAGDWGAAAAAFEDAAVADPGLTLYWQHAAYARTRAGDVAVALPLWRRAADDDPYWPLLPATVGVLTGSRSQLASALELSEAGSHLLVLNEGALAEAAGDAAGAHGAYVAALDLRPSSAAALFWQQTPLREAVLAEWEATRASDNSPLAMGQRALAAGQAQESVEHFQQAVEQNPIEVAAYAGLAEAHRALGDTARAQQAWQAGMWVPVTTLDQTLALRQLAGDWARARGDLETAAEAYALVFSAVNEYTLFGPGTYGNPQRSWYVFRRQALNADVVPQFAQADITAAMDERFAWLATWMAERGDREIACLIAERVRREAPVSVSGAYWAAACE